MVVLGWGMVTTEAHATVCSRTTAVRDAIVDLVSGKTSCSSITDTDLAGITTLDLYNKSINSLKAGDFASLTGWTSLNLILNNLSSLPSGIFDPLTALMDLRLYDNKLTSLTELNFTENSFTTLSPGIFDNLTSLQKPYLSSNSLSCLPFVPTSVTNFFCGQYSFKLRGLRCRCHSEQEQSVCRRQQQQNLHAGVEGKPQPLRQ